MFVACKEEINREAKFKGARERVVIIEEVIPEGDRRRRGDQHR